MRRPGRPRLPRHARHAGEDHDGLAAVARGQAPIPPLSRARPGGGLGLARDGSSASAVARRPPAPDRVSGLDEGLRLRPVESTPGVCPVTPSVVLCTRGGGFADVVLFSAVDSLQPASGPQHVHYLLRDFVPGRDCVARAMVNHGFVYCGSCPTASCEGLPQFRSFMPGGEKQEEANLPLNLGDTRCATRYTSCNSSNRREKNWPPNLVEGSAG